MNPITLNESIRLFGLLAIIKIGKKAFVQVGNALSEIRDKRLYCVAYATFDDYCREKWGWSKTHCNRLIEASGVAIDLTPIGVKLPNESQARALASVPRNKRAAVFEVASVSADLAKKPLTAKLIAQAAEVVSRPPDPEPPSEAQRNDAKFKAALGGKVKNCFPMPRDWMPPVPDDGAELARHLDAFESDLLAMIQAIPHGADLKAYVSVLQRQTVSVQNRLATAKNARAYL